jgi:alcohol dehydrogenase (NADP+)
MAATQNYKFEGWMGLDKEAAKGKMVWQEFQPKPFEETDVDIEITHSGICGSDIHTISSGWGAAKYRESFSTILVTDLCTSTSC